MELNSSEKRKLKKMRVAQNIRKSPKHVAMITDDGRVLHPTKGFDNKARSRGANPRSQRIKKVA